MSRRFDTAPGYIPRIETAPVTKISSILTRYQVSYIYSSFSYQVLGFEYRWPSYACVLHQTLLTANRHSWVLNFLEIEPYDSFCYDCYEYEPLEDCTPIVGTNHLELQ